MLLADATVPDIEAHLAGAGLALDFGAGRARILSDVAELAPILKRVYGGFALENPRGFFDATVTLRHARGVRRHWRAQVEFIADGAAVFEPFPADTHLPLLEWGLNYLFADRLNFHLLLHAGVVEKRGRAVVLPAMPGSGKSTLTAALTARGFRLLSDEFGIVRLADAQLLPLLRPIGLKNESIDVIARFAPQAPLGPRFPKTRKGTVAHLAPADAAIAARHVPARAALIVFPRFDPAVETQVAPIPKARAFGRLAVNSFNYETLGPAGFDAVSRLVAHSDSFQLVFRDLEQAINAIEQRLGTD